MAKYNVVVPKVNQIISQYTYPLTLRQIYYRLVAAGVVENTMSNYVNLSKILTKARERGEVDYRQIEDRVRSTIKDHYALSEPHDLYEMMSRTLDYAARKYRHNPWIDQDTYLEVWLEKDALSTVVSRVATDMYSVSVAVNRGYGSYSFVREGAERLSEFGNKSTIILYFGDFDASGEDMVRDLQNRIVQYGAVDTTVHKIALTEEQIKTYNLPPDPTKRSDPRAKDFIEKHGEVSAVELDALDPKILGAIVQTAIEKYIDRPQWDESTAKTTAERELIDAKMAEVHEILGH